MVSKKKESMIHSGGRKTSCAVIKISKCHIPHDLIIVNGLFLEFHFEGYPLILRHLFEVLNILKYYNRKLKKKASKYYLIYFTINGGGYSAQAQAIRLGLCKAFIGLNPKLKPMIRHYGFLRRDSRMKERRKYGLKKARRAPQYSKR